MTIRNPERNRGTLTPAMVSGSSKKRSSSLPAVTRNAPATLPVTLPMPPKTTISRISYVRATWKVLESMDRINMASIPPPTPVKKEEITKESSL